MMSNNYCQEVTDTKSKAGSTTYIRTEDSKLVVKDVDMDFILGEGVSSMTITSGAS